MKKQKKFFMIIILIYITLLLPNHQVQAVRTTDGEIEISQNYLEYINLTDEEKENVIIPTMYDMPKNNISTKNPFKLARLMRSSTQPYYSLKDIIPENMIIKNQSSTSLCWAFASLASLESHLALKDYKYGKTPVVYDFSERHMDYATTSVFLDEKVNKFGFNRNPGSNGNNGIPIAYFTNGSGAVDEKNMEFSTNVDLIDISEIQNKEIVTQVNDIITFPAYSITEDTTQIKQQIKEHIMNYGAIKANINSNVNEVGAIYCSDSSVYKINHSVAIVGWDDEYSVEKFNIENRPKNSGAWIAKDSYGTERGNGGIVYISYEDANVYKNLTGIEDAQTDITYEHIYQYDELGGYLKYKIKNTNKIYIAQEYDKKTTGKEYITQISVKTPEKYECKVFINPNSTDKDAKYLQQVELKTGDTAIFEAGYHTIEFANPIKIGNQFAIVMEITGSQEDIISILTEVNYGEFFTDSKYANDANHAYDTVTISDGKCFIATEEEKSDNEWTDTSKLYEVTSGKVPNFDTTIKAFTTSKILEEIEITIPPKKTTYVEGQNIDTTGMVVNAKYANGETIEITDYSILNGDNLAINQKEVTIIYQNKTAKQSINVVENKIESISIKTKPIKKEYWAGEKFDPTGMIVEAIYTDETKKEITDYIIQNGNALQNGQETVTIEYEGKKITQNIIVKNNSIVKLEIKSNAKKLDYVVGQNFNTNGLILKATYVSGLEIEVTDTDYVVKNGKNLQKDQTIITIEFEGQTVTQTIKVEEKIVTEIKVQTKPTKTEYIQGKNKLDLTGGTIKVFYNDGTEEEIPMTSSEIKIEGFENEKPGKKTIKVIYQGKNTEFEIKVKELEKPTNSNFANIQAKIKDVRTYYADKNQKENMIINIELSNIIIATDNENMEYYYYLSSNPNEENITNWIKITNVELASANIGNKLSFEVNSLDITNYEELVKVDKLFLYVKEISKRNNMKIENITDAIILNMDNINIEKIDNTVASGEIPKAGGKILSACLIIIAIAILVRITYLKYKNIEI